MWTAGCSTRRVRQEERPSSSTREAIPPLVVWSMDHRRRGDPSSHRREHTGQVQATWRGIVLKVDVEGAEEKTAARARSSVLSASSLSFRAPRPHYLDNIIKFMNENDYVLFRERGWLADAGSGAISKPPSICLHVPAPSTKLAAGQH